MLSPGSRSRMWDADADGYARGEGVAAVVLKTLSAALEDNDHIECVIRETGVSQDGRTKGITMPSAQAQSALIRDTYAKAGLEINNKHDRCQYFEAHGTGTPAGDPVEAEAISHAFSDDRLGFDAGNVLYVGSVKTVIGHTEGTAGIAGLLKVSLALQHSIIPPNMLFRHLNPAIEPFYGKLQIPTTAQVWPHLPAGTPRRASVNSFGFGGTNAHAILESYEPDEAPNNVTHASACTPFVFSATSEMSLATTIARYSAYLKANPSTNLRDLAWTLHSRRSAFPVRASFPGLTVESLCSSLDAAIETTRGVLHASIGTRSTSSSTRIFGVFTGQGAQWALMGRDLILNSDFVRKSIESLESVLADLPTSDRPSWSLKDELLTEASSSRLGEATLSQPLCTAIQIVLVDLLRKANINFDAVVGHSSGEIAAAYAANFISSRDAILIAYYRGFYAKLACGHNQRKGAMLAVGTSPEDAEDFCTLPKFKGYISVAACNASSSVTLSGDADVIEEAKDVFEDEKKFARLLKVDKAYHSHHMTPCSEPYLQSLRACNIRIQRPSKPSCSWFSSVYEGKLMEACEELRDVYWVKNMTQPVLFSQAVTNAFVESVQFGVALEVGPHPALKGPATQTIQHVTTEVIPYSGLLARGVNDVAAFANALGFVWTYLGKSVVDFNNYDEFFYDDRRPKLLKDLPHYAWDHDRNFWHESRVSRLFRARKEPVHELLGTRSSDGAEGEIRWRNLLRPSEVPWLNGHQLQGQTVFPAAGYAVTALEAAMVLAGERSVQLIEIQDLVIGRPMTFDDDISGVETLITLSNIMAEQTSRDVLLTSFVYYCAANKESDSLVMIASGRISVLLGEPSHVHLPYRAEMAPDMVDVDVDRFYSSLNDLGYGYSGPFRALSSMKRKMSMGRGLVAKPPSSNEGNALLVHPAMLDAAFQSIFLGYCWPGDGRLWSLHVPTSVHRIRVNPSLCYPHTNQDIFLPFDSTLDDSTDRTIQGDVDIYAKDGQNAMIQIEGVSIVPFAPASAADDCQLFSHMVWDVAFPDAGLFAEKNRAQADEIELATLLKRVSYFYLRNLDRQVTPGELERSEWHHKKLFDYAYHISALVESGKQPFGEMEWMQDTHDQIVAMMNEYVMSNVSLYVQIRLTPVNIRQHRGQQVMSMCIRCCLISQSSYLILVSDIRTALNSGLCVQSAKTYRQL